MTNTGPLHDYSSSRAVLIGVSDYANLTPVPPALNSLNRMEGLLTGPLCGWPKQRVETLPGIRKRDGLPDQLMELFDDVVDIALFYFVGHGQLHDDELCLALAESPEAGARRTTVGLPFSDVRAALRACDAQTKIVILDCCFAGVGTQPEHSLTGASADVVTRTHVAGAFTMAASGAYRTAWFDPDRDTANPQTYFTKYLIDVVERGLPGYADGLPLRAIYESAAEALARDKLPEPTRSVRHDAARFILAHNVYNVAELAVSPAASPEPPSTPASPPRGAAEGSSAPQAKAIQAVRLFSGCPDRVMR